MKLKTNHSNNQELAYAIGRMARDPVLCDAILKSDGFDMPSLGVELDEEKLTQLKTAARFITSEGAKGNLSRFIDNVRIARNGLRVIE